MTIDQQTIPTLEGLRSHRDEILSLAARYRATNVRVFGSVARGEATANSDVDLLVTFLDGASLFEASGLWQDLQDLLGWEVSLLSDGIEDERFMRRIEADVVRL